MPLSFILIVGALFVFVGLSLGSAVKMHGYGVNGFLLIFSPFLVIIVFVVLPVFVIAIFLAHIDILKDKVDAHFYNEITKMTLLKRLVLSFELVSFFVKLAPFWVGIISYIGSSLINQQQIPKDKRDLIWVPIRNFAAGI